jgi:hypothetical protein
MTGGSSRKRKVKRLRHDPRVEVRPCGRFGKVSGDAQPVAGIAELREQPADVERTRALIRSAFPLESRVVLGIERLVERLRGGPRTPRLGLYIGEAPFNASIEGADLFTGPVP